jgi:hypothetical protein
MDVAWLTGVGVPYVLERNGYLVPSSPYDPFN